MHPDLIQRLGRGDHITAEQWNLRGELLRRGQGGDSLATDATGAYHRAIQQRRDLVLVKNKSGAARQRFEVLGLSDALYGPGADMEEFTYRVGFEGVVPALPDHRIKWGVLQEQVNNNGVAVVKVSGATQVKVDIQNEGEWFAYPKDGDPTMLQSTSGRGAPILWAPEVYPGQQATGEQWCIVRLEYVGGAGPATIRFYITDPAPFLGEQFSVCKAVRGRVYDISCGGASVSIDDQVLVWDPSGCWFDVPLSLLRGSWGVATEMSRESGTAIYGEVADCIEYGLCEGECWWMVEHLCCTENIYGG